MNPFEELFEEKQLDKLIKLKEENRVMKQALTDIADKPFYTREYMVDTAKKALDKII